MTIYALVTLMYRVPKAAVLARLGGRSKVNTTRTVLEAKLDYPSMVVNGLGYEIYACAIPPKDRGQHWLEPHAHACGDEPYVLLEGMLEINTGELQADDRVAWQRRRVRGGRIHHVVHEDTAHMLINPAEKTLLVLYACPPEHLKGAVGGFADYLPVNSMPDWFKP